MGLSQLPHLSGRSRFNFLDPGAGYELLSIWISPVDGLDVEYGGQLENRGSLALPEFMYKTWVFIWECNCSKVTVILSTYFACGGKEVCYVLVYSVLPPDERKKNGA